MLKLNGNVITPTIFPDGTSQVWKLEVPPIGDHNNIEWIFESEAEFIHLAQLVDLINHPFRTNSTLILPYLPYARQDKEITNTTTFALRTFAVLLNRLKFDHVEVRDPHSEIALGLINNIKPYFATKVLGQLTCDYQNICFPDAGAMARYSKFFVEHNIIYGRKTRDQLTGYITDYSISGTVKDLEILIIDDICDGGMTFRLLAREMKKQGAKEVSLYVSHGIFSKGRDVLHQDGIDNIYTGE